MLLLIDEAIECLNTETRILNLRIKYPEQFNNHKKQLSTSHLFLTEKTSLINIMELVSSLFLSKQVISHNGLPVPLSVIARAFEDLFNIKLGDYYKKHESVISRRSSNLTEFLDTLRKTIQEDSKNKGYR